MMLEREHSLKKYIENLERNVINSNILENKKADLK